MLDPPFRNKALQYPLNQANLFQKLKFHRWIRLNLWNLSIQSSFAKKIFEIRIGKFLIFLIFNLFSNNSQITNFCFSIFTEHAYFSNLKRRLKNIKSVLIRNKQFIGAK